MLGTRKIDSLTTLFVRGGFFRRAGAGRSLAAHYAQARYDVVAVSEISPGDALAFATRFDMQWAYRGSQALFWVDVFEHAQCSDLYLPLHLRRPFQRRGLVHVRVEIGGESLDLAVTECSTARDARAVELQFVRKALRSVTAKSLLFAACADAGFTFYLPGWQFARSGVAGLAHATRAVRSGGAEAVALPIPAVAQRFVLGSAATA